jgi:hypothetical protein
MKYLCLINLNEQELDAMEPAAASDLNDRHHVYNDELKKHGHFIVAEALEPVRTTARVTVRNGKTSVVDGPFTETKEMVAGFYFIEAQDMTEAIAIASRIPGVEAGLATVDVRPARKLEIDGKTPRWGSENEG